MVVSSEWIHSMMLVYMISKAPSRSGIYHVLAMTEMTSVYRESDVISSSEISRQVSVCKQYLASFCFISNHITAGLFTLLGRFITVDAPQLEEHSLAYYLVVTFLLGCSSFLNWLELVSDILAFVCGLVSVLSTCYTVYGHGLNPRVIKIDTWLRLRVVTMHECSNQDLMVFSLDYDSLLFENLASTPKASVLTWF